MAVCPFRLRYVRLLVAGPSPDWDDRQAIDIIDAIDAAAGTALELPAPNLSGVIRKLELLWEDDRCDPIDGPFCVFLLGDLHRLVRPVAARTDLSESQTI